MIAMVDEQRLQHLAAECLHISERTGDERTASELVKLSHQVLELATPSLRGSRASQSLSVALAPIRMIAGSRAHRPPLPR